MPTIATSLFTKPNAEIEAISISARLTGDYAELWRFLTQCMGESKPTVIVRDSIRLLAFVAHQTILGKKIKTVVVDDNGEEVKVDDLVGYLKLSLPDNIGAETKHSKRGRLAASL